MYCHLQHREQKQSHFAPLLVKELPCYLFLLLINEAEYHDYTNSVKIILQNDICDKGERKYTELTNWAFLSLKDKILDAIAMEFNREFLFSYFGLFYNYYFLFACICAPCACLLAFRGQKKLLNP